MREPDWQPETAHGGTPMWGWLIIANVLCFILQYTVKGFYSYLALYPELLKQGHVYQLLTFQFLHGDLFHIIINCLMIWMIGKPIEEALGKRRMLSLYLISGIAGGVIQCAFAWTDINPTGGVVGASAGVFGLIAAFAVLQWNREMTILLMFIIPIKAAWVAWGSGLLCLLHLLSDRDMSSAMWLSGWISGYLWIRGGIELPLKRFWLRRKHTKIKKRLSTFDVIEGGKGWGSSSDGDDLVH